MTQLHGTYFNGVIHLEKIIKTDEPLKVTITFDEVEKETRKGMKFSDFGFLKSQQQLKHIKTSFSDEVERERRSAA